MSGREKIWFNNEVIWIRLPDEPEEDQEPDDDLWPELMLALECLTPKQRFVIECRYGLRSTGEVLELAEIAHLMGVSKQSVHKIEVRAIESMRRVTRTIERDAQN